MLSLAWLGAQLAAALVRPEAGVVTIAGLAGQCLIIAALAGWRAQRRDRRAPFVALAAGMILWAAGYVAIGIEEVIVGAQPPSALLNDALFIGKGAPFLVLFTLALAYRPFKQRLSLDVPGLVVFIALSVVLVFDPLIARAAPIELAHAARSVENMLLAVLAVCAVAVQRRAEDRWLYRSVAVLLVVYAVQSELVNRYLLEPVSIPPGSAWLVPSVLPFVLFHVSDAWRPGPRSSAARGLLPARRLAAMLLPAGSLVIAFVLVWRGTIAGAVLGMAALIAFAWRTSRVQTDAAAANVALRRSGRRFAALAATDPLTGLPNRREFHAALAAAWDRAHAAGASVALLAIDLDWFKRLNDSRGHAAGDECLRRVAAVLAEAMPSGWNVARLGGEEFAAVGVAAPASARDLGEHVRRRIEALALANPGSPFGHVTASVGVAVAAPDAPSNAAAAAMLLAQADAALYAAKAAGRNRLAGMADDGSVGTVNPVGTANDAWPLAAVGDTVG